jgi:hypothetical protein
MLFSLSFLSLCLCQSETPAPKQADRLKELAGQWVVLKSDPGSGEKVVPAELLGLTAKGTEVIVKGNELSSGGKVIATLTTDFSDSGLDLDKTVHVSRRPVLVTLPSGKGLLCAYESHGNKGFTLCYPHNMGRVSAGTWLTIGLPTK